MNIPGSMSEKWTEHTLEYGFSSQFFPVSFSCLSKSFIHVRRPSGSFRSVTNIFVFFIAEAIFFTQCGSRVILFFSAEYA